MSATSYGALSGDAGDARVSCDVQLEGAITFHWLENRQPQVTLQEKSGFGSVLIEPIVASCVNGSAAPDFDPSGVASHLSGKISPLVAPADTRPQMIHMWRKPSLVTPGALDVSRYRIPASFR